MKKFIISIILLCSLSNLFAQEEETSNSQYSHLGIGIAPTIGLAGFAKPMVGLDFNVAIGDMLGLVDKNNSGAHAFFGSDVSPKRTDFPLMVIHANFGYTAYTNMYQSVSLVNNHYQYDYFYGLGSEFALSLDINFQYPWASIGSPEKLVIQFYSGVGTGISMAFGSSTYVGANLNLIPIGTRILFNKQFELFMELTVASSIGYSSAFSQQYTDDDGNIYNPHAVVLWPGVVVGGVAISGGITSSLGFRWWI